MVEFLCFVTVARSFSCPGLDEDLAKIELSLQSMCVLAASHIHLVSCVFWFSRLPEEVMTTGGM